MTAQPDFAQDSDELFDVVNEDGSPTGIVKRRADVHRDGDWHRAIHVWLYGANDLGPFMLMNRRGRHKDTWPGMLDVTVGGHLAAGETVVQAFREIEEEIGVAADPARLQFIETRPGYGQVERELQEVFLYRDDRPLNEYRPNPAELEGLVMISLTDAQAIFTMTSSSVEATLLRAVDRVVAPYTVSSRDLIPVRDRYYERIAAAIGVSIQQNATGIL